MRPETAKRLRCLSCGSTDREIVVAKRSGEEIEEGLLVCKRCGYTYAIIEGIIRTINDEHRRNALEKYRELIPESLRDLAR